MSNESAWFWAATTLYALSVVGFVVWVGFRREGAARLAGLAAVCGLVPHAVSLGLRWAAVGHGPYSTRYEVVSANALLLVLVYLASARFARGLRALGVFVMPVAFLMMGFAVMTFELKSDVPIIFKSYWLWLHIGFAKLFAATIVLAAACAGAYLVKQRRAEALPQLPPPARLELLAHQLMLVSFLFLGVMIVAGALWARQSWGRYWAWDPIETSALCTWIVMGVVLHFRALHGWSGKRMAYLTFVALAFSLVTAYVVAMIVPTIHNSYLVGQ